MSEMSQAQQPAVNDADPDPSADIVPPAATDTDDDRADQDTTSTVDEPDVTDGDAGGGPDLQAIAHRSADTGDADQSASDPMPNV